MTHTIVFGAGPAGLSAAYAMARDDRSVTVLEKTDTVGGISRTICHNGYYFDLGGHRFFTKFDEVQALWEEVLGDEFLVRPRLSRIFYGGKFYDYPLRASNALRNLGLVESARCIASYARARGRRRGSEKNLEEWVANRFGDRLYEIFFKTYTEKVWGIPCSEIGADWAAQRIKNMELSTAVKNALAKRLGRFSSSNAEVVTSLIEEFYYPRTGPGLMYDRMLEKTTSLGGHVHFEQPVVRVEREGFVVKRAITRDSKGNETVYDGDAFLSSMPLTLLIRALHPAVPENVRVAAESLTFRNLLTIDLIVDAPDLFPDNWIYVHDEALQLGRIQNFKNWSPHMVPDPTTTSLGLEYFCSDSDPIWNMTTPELIELGTKEMRQTGLLPSSARILDGTAVKVPKAYPVYKAGYDAHLDTLVEYLKRFTNLQPMGRYGMFKYNNADHSILTALLAVENIYDGAHHNIWSVNTDTAYHEIRRGKY